MKEHVGMSKLYSGLSTYVGYMEVVCLILGPT